MCSVNLVIVVYLHELVIIMFDYLIIMDYGDLMELVFV